MSRYALWNNKGGVGKSFLTFSLACEYALANPDEDVLVLDLCPQANLTEMFLGGKDIASTALEQFYAQKPRRSVGGYFEARLTSPFLLLPDISDFLCKPCEFNANIPENITLLAGDNLLELLAEAIRGVAQLPLPSDAWAKVMRWLVDLTRTFSDDSTASDVVTFVDCNPSFSIYTQIALCSAENLLVPFTADDSSRRGIENVFALLYGLASSELQGYARLSFSNRANQEKIELPRIHSFVSNRATYYRGKPSSAFEAKSAPIKRLVEGAALSGKRYFANYRQMSDLFAEMPDYHSVAVVASSEGCPLSLMKSGHHDVDGDTVQVNQISINKYQKAIGKLVGRL
ncbi:ParA family protein [Comamonas terrigena]|uniref:ParA family protein n=1 Tax=Comamonas terrigena TaxID=32013 RepID=UPI00244C267B|nr:ParA family protein [Comamonas terrigena]MDH0049256.1 ParA family protein [Comamonas terrigena]MDH0511955.1 ParA family protein [Comamonas terrigena]MDH1091667.1 ParA family protein [Comamonas terrigena]